MTYNNSIKDSPQKDMGLDAQKAARPLLLGVNVKGMNLDENSQDLNVVDMLELFVGASVEEMVLMILVMLIWISIYIYVVIQSKKGVALNIKGANKIYRGLLGSILVGIFSVTALFFIEESIEENTFILLSYGIELISLSFLAYAALGFKELISDIRERLH